MTPVKYILTERALIGNEIFEAGAEITYGGLPSANMIPLCDEGEARRKQTVEYDKRGRFENQPPIDTPALNTPEAATAAAAAEKAAALRRKKAKGKDDDLA